MSTAPAQATATSGRLSHHIAETIRIAGPIALAQLGQISLGLTDQIMLGGISDAALAAGGLGAGLFFTVLLALQGIVSGVPVLAARARGAGTPQHVPQTYWSGVVIAAVVSVPFFLLMSHPGPILRAVGEPAALANDVTAYLGVLRWGVPAGMLGLGLLRGFLPAIGLQTLMMWIMPFGIALNAVLNIWFIQGGLGLPGYGMRGSAAATVVTMWSMALSTAGALHLHPEWRHHVRPTAPARPMLRELLTLGLPVAVTVLVEAALFTATGLVVGVLGQVPLAAHTVALSIASVTFMVPLGISQAANVRVAEAMGAGNPRAARLAGFTAIGIAVAFMACAAAVMKLAPAPIVRLYLAPGAAATATATLLRVAAAFQMVDGTQVAASGALRGLKDTRVPMLLATVGYWGIGFWTGRMLAFSFAMGVVGLWWGLFAGLAVTAVALAARFAVLSARLVREG